MAPWALRSWLVTGTGSTVSKTKKTSKQSSGGGFSGYLEESSDLFNSIFLVLPLFLVYQVGVLMTGGIRNGVDFMSDLMWLVAGNSLGAYLGINLLILLAFGIATYFLRESGTFRPKLWPLVVAESTVYALLLGSGVILLMSSLGLDVLLSTGPDGEYGLLTKIVLSFGAGLYEETVFRLVLMGGLFAAGVKWGNLSKWVAALGAVILSSFIFSAIHYVGPLADAFTLGSFFFRFFAGVLLAGIFYLRGFAVAVYTHAIYDIIVMVFH